MKIQNIIKVLWKFNFESKVLKPSRAPTVTSLKWPLATTYQRIGRVGPPGAGNPRGWPAPDQAFSPPPSYDGLWASPKSLLGCYFTRMM